MYEDGIYEDGKAIVLTSVVEKDDVAAKTGLTIFEEGKINGDVETLGFSDEAAGIPEKIPNLEDEVVEKAEAALKGVEKVYSTVEEVNENIKSDISGEV